MKKYQIIYADPPWSYNDKRLNQGGAETHYNTMNLEDIKLLPIKNISNDNCMLFIWGTWPNLQECLDVINAWGFIYKTIGFIWIKTNKNTKTNQLNLLGSLLEDNFQYDTFVNPMGHYTKPNSEFCLIGKKGKINILNNSIKSVIYYPIMEHSRKPDIVKDKIIQLIGDLPRIELFARKQTEGWDVFGNQVENSINL